MAYWASHFLPVLRVSKVLDSPRLLLNIFIIFLVRAESNYHILDTDYETFAVVYSCTSILNLVNGKIVWILSRTRFPSQSILDRAYDIIRINGLSTSFLATTDNSDCPDEISNSIDNFRYQHIDLD